VVFFFFQEIGEGEREKEGKKGIVEAPSSTPKKTF
jgi:hypothetical protein